MKIRLLLVLAILFAMSAAVYGQAGLSGKWQTDNVPAALAAQAAVPAAAEAGGRGGRGGGGGGQAIIMDFKVDGTKVSGTVNEIGNGDPLTIESGTISGKTLTLVTQPRGVTWNIEMTDDNTISVMSRVFAARGAGGAAGGRGPGAGAPGGGATGPQAGAPPAGGGPGGPGAGGGAAGAGPGAPGGGAPAGAGGPGAGGGRGGGVGARGPGQPIVLHRVK